MSNRNLDVLRAVAVLCVVADHCIEIGQPELPSARLLGRFGVLIFFVHTALVLLLSLQRHGGSRRTTRQFYLQRLFRIYPLSISCIAVVLFCHVPWEPDARFEFPAAVDLIRNLTLTQNLAPGHSIAGPMWSLPYEVQMYLLLPWIWWFVRKYSTDGVWVLTFAAIIIATAERLILSQTLWITCFLPCFMGGVLAFVTYKRRPILPALLWPLAIFLFWLLAIATSRITSPINEWLLCLVLGVSIPFFRQVRKGVASTAASLIARYSYAIYLSHQLLLWLCFRRISAPRGIQWASFAMLSLLLPVLLYHLLEAPMILLGKRLAGRMDEKKTKLLDDHQVPQPQDRQIGATL
jgi:peptidoglycan/LPS O-acetylase OafA/YrhL